MGSDAAPGCSKGKAAQRCFDEHDAANRVAFSSEATPAWVALMLLLLLLLLLLLVAWRLATAVAAVAPSDPWE